MPRIRSIKPEFPQSESMGRVSREARLTFVMLWTIADDSGRARGHSRALASLLYPYDDDAPGLIDGWLAELEREGCIVRYVVGGAHYVQCCNWLAHQKIDKPSKSKMPAPREASPNPREDSRNLSDGSGSGSKDLDLGEERDQGAPARLAPAPLSLSPSPTEHLLEHWRAVAERYGVLETALRSPKVEHQAHALLTAHALDVLRAAVVAFWDAPQFEGKRNFGLFAANAGQLVAHVQAGHRHRFGERASRHEPAIGPVGACPHNHEPPCRTAQACTRRWLDEERARQGIGPRQTSPLSVSA